MDMETKIRLLQVMLYEIAQEMEFAKELYMPETLKFDVGYRGALENAIDILKNDEFAQSMIDYYTGKGAK